MSLFRQHNHKIADLRSSWPARVGPSERYPTELFDEHDNVPEPEGLDRSTLVQLLRD